MASRRGRASSRRPASTESNARATGSVGRSVRLHIFIHTFISLLRTARRPRARARTPRVAARRRRLTRSHPHPSRSTDASIAPPSLEPPTPSGGRGLEPARIIESSVIHHRVTPPPASPQASSPSTNRAIETNGFLSTHHSVERSVARTASQAPTVAVAKTILRKPTATSFPGPRRAIARIERRTGRRVCTVCIGFRDPAPSLVDTAPGVDRARDDDGTTGVGAVGGGLVTVCDSTGCIVCGIRADESIVDDSSTVMS